MLQLDLNKINLTLFDIRFFLGLSTNNYCNPNV